MQPDLKTALHGMPRDREPAFAFMSRIGSVGGVSASDFGHDIGVPFPAVLDADPAALARLASLTGCDVAQLTAWTPLKTASKRRNLREQSFPSKTLLTSRIRGCPLCLRYDMENSDLPPHRAMTFRAGWLVPHVSVCVQHEHALVDLWKEVPPQARYDTAARFRQILPLVQNGAFEGEYREPTDFDTWLHGRLVDGAATDSFVDRHPLLAAATFCRLLGFALLRHEGIAPEDVAEGSDWACCQMGYEVAQQGEDAVFDALTGLNRLAEPRLGPKAVFPMLYDRLTREHARDPDFAPFRELFADHLRRTWPLGPGDTLLGEPVTERLLHSVRTAADETGIDSRRLRKLLEAAGLIDADLPDGWAVFDVEAGKDILASLTALMTAKDFAAALGMTRSQFDLLVEDDCLQPALVDATTKHVWDLRDGHRFLDTLLDRAETVDDVGAGWVHIAKSAQRLKCRPGDIVEAIEDGRITKVGRHSGADGYRSVLVWHEDVVRVLASDTAPAMTLGGFAEHIGIGQPVFVSRLIRNGHMSVTELRNPRTKALQPYVTEADAAAFHRRFATLHTLARETGETWQKLSRQLRRAGVAPFSPDGVDYGRLYLRSEAEAALR